MTTPPPPQQPRTRKRLSTAFVVTVILVLLVAGVVGWNTGVLKPRPTVALITNNADPFWDPVIQGAQDAADQYGLKLTVVKGTGDPTAQTASVRQLMNQGIRGLGISPIAPIEQTEALREVAVRMPLVTVDSDCPDSSRLWFVGTDNYVAGRQCGSYVRDAIPEGGEVLICIGSLTADNARLRRQGVIDDLLDRTYSRTQDDPVDAVVKGDKYTVVGTCVDDHNKDRATALAAAAIKSHPNLKCIVALYSYSAPAVIEALRQTGKLGQIQVVGFDVLPETLDAVEAGYVFATMRQAQYDFGFDTVRGLAAALSGDSRAASFTPMRCFGVSVVMKDDVPKVRQELTHPTALANATK